MSSVQREGTGGRCMAAPPADCAVDKGKCPPKAGKIAGSICGVPAHSSHPRSVPRYIHSSSGMHTAAAMMTPGAMFTMKSMKPAAAAERMQCS